MWAWMEGTSREVVTDQLRFVSVAFPTATLDVVLCAKPQDAL